jgi:hypothetical protein
MAQMQVIIHDQAKERFLKPFKLDVVEVRDAIVNSDNSQELKLRAANMHLMWFSKKIEDMVDEYFLVVCCNRRGPALQLMEAYKLPGSVCNEDDDDSMPLQLFKKLLDEYGLDMRIGERTEKLLVSQRVPYDPNGGMVHPVEVINPKGHRYMGVSMYAMVDGDEPYLDCSICYALDTTTYLEAIHQDDDFDI